MLSLIMAGGSGTRFWPQSRESLPKQFLKLFNNKSMLRLTYERLLSFIESKDIYIVTAQGQVELIKEHLPELTSEQIIIEPMGMNTAPCIALATLYLQARYNSNEPMLVLPADHYIPDIDAFSGAMSTALKVAQEHNYLITFGIIPTYPATGYGYIETGKGFLPKMFHVKHFKEKPDLATALGFLEQKNYLWNSGMFCWNIATILDSFHKYNADILRVADKTLQENDRNKQKEIYKTIPKTPIDIAILEKADNVITMPLNFTWSDVGNWFSLSELMPKDEYNNYFANNGYVIDSEGNSVFVDKFTALIDVSNLLVIDTHDALLITHRDRGEAVKQVVEYLKENKKELL
jgi:mannose-1-phosphate guanylyltransferase